MPIAKQGKTSGDNVASSRTNDDAVVVNSIRRTLVESSSKSKSVQVEVEEGQGGVSTISTTSSLRGTNSREEEEEEEGGESAADERIAPRSSKRPRPANEDDERRPAPPPTAAPSTAPAGFEHLDDHNFDDAALSGMACGSCVLCRMPRCERCQACRDSVDTDDDGDCCLRKVCIAIPIEFKLRAASGLGFPEPGWRFAFDDPQKTSLVVSTKRVPAGLAGLRLVSPGGTTFHSFESAFARVPWRTGAGATDASERFLAHVGSPEHVSIPHFLVGKNYCIEFQRGGSSDDDDDGRRNENIVLFGTIVSCMGPSRPSPEGCRPNARTGDDEAKSFFVVRYDDDVLSVARKGAGGAAIRPIQLLRSELAWGGCISYERKTCCRRDARTSAIQNIDQATAVETWIAPDMRLEEMEDATRGSDGECSSSGSRPLPRLTVFARGYRFVFRVKTIPRDDEDCGKVNNKTNKQQQFGVFASCKPLSGENDAHQEINLKPGELIDLGTLAGSHDAGERKSLSAFIVKNYVHNFKVGRWGVLSGRGDEVCDPTDDASGRLLPAASRRVLSYVRRRGAVDRPSEDSDGEQRRPARRPTLVARIAPDASVHALFGVRYEGNWAEYEAGMQELAPLFGGREVEVTACRSYGFGTRRVAEAKCLRSIGVFQAEDVVACAHQLRRMFDGAETADRRPSDKVHRSRQVVELLLERTESLLGMFSDAKFREGGGPDKSPLTSARDDLIELGEMLEGHRNK